MPILFFLFPPKGGAAAAAISYHDRDVQLPSPNGLDTTLPETSSFPFADEDADHPHPRGATASTSSYGSDSVFGPELPKKEPKRKRSQYDNVVSEAEALAPPVPPMKNPTHQRLFRGLISSHSFDSAGHQVEGGGGGIDPANQCCATADPSLSRR